MNEEIYRKSLQTRKLARKFWLTSNSEIARIWNIILRYVAQIRTLLSQIIRLCLIISTKINSRSCALALISAFLQNRVSLSVTLTANFLAPTAKFLQLPIFNPALCPHNSILLPIESQLKKKVKLKPSSSFISPSLLAHPTSKYLTGCY